jgi:hypothetical protein
VKQPAPGTVPTHNPIAQKLKAFMGAIALMLVGPVQADYPIVSHHYAADPAAVEFNGRLYVYCSNDDENGTNGYLMSSITCFSTDDLKNWTDHGVAFRANTTSWASLTWAPSAVSNQNKVFLYFANGAGSIGVATSSVPSGPFTDARGSSLINSSTPGAATATQWLFDPCGFVDDGGQAYLYFGGQYPTNARVIQLNANLTSVNGSAAPMFATNFFEASYMHKRNGIYYYTYCNRFEFGAAIYCETNSNPTTGFVPQARYCRTRRRTSTTTIITPSFRIWATGISFITTVRRRWPTGFPTLMRFTNAASASTPSTTTRTAPSSRSRPRRMD